MSHGNSPFRSPSPYYQPPQVVVVQQAPPPQSQLVPALLNFFCLPGLGQLVQGRPMAALLWYIAASLALASVALFGVGLILFPLVVILCVVDAARFNPSQYQGNTSGPLAIIFGAMCMVGGVLVLGLIGFLVLGAFLSHTPTPTPSSVESGFEIDLD